MSRTAEIRRRLEQGFAPAMLEVEDQSAQHIGHAGYQEGGESHFHVRMQAQALAGLSRIARHRAVHDAIGPELMGQIHALSMELSD